MKSKRIPGWAWLTFGLVGLLPVLAGCSPPPAHQPPVLFVGNDGTDSVATFKNLLGMTGNVPPDDNLRGLQTGLSGPESLAVNAAGQLLVCNYQGHSITVYGDAQNTNGNVAPERTVKGPATELSYPVSLSIDRARDLVYVLNTGGANRSILVFAKTSKPEFDGNAAPVRKITSPNLNGGLVGSFLDDADNLYVADYGSPLAKPPIPADIKVFAAASTLNGTYAPTRTLTGPAFDGINDVFVDRNDNLFAVINTGLVRVIRFGSMQDGLTTPAANLFIEGSKSAIGIAVDADDTGYLLDPNSNAVYVVDKISTRDGTFPADRTIKGANAQLNQPVSAFLLEK